MAQLSAAETLTSLVGRQLPGLFGATAADVQDAFANLSTSNGFTLVAREFFSRLTNRALGHFLSRELSKHVGPNKRFAGINEHSEFNAALTAAGVADHQGVRRWMVRQDSVSRGAGQLAVWNAHHDEQ
jgi:hypothetical protein